MGFGLLGMKDTKMEKPIYHYKGSCIWAFQSLNRVEPLLTDTPLKRTHTSSPNDFFTKHCYYPHSEVTSIKQKQTKLNNLS
jgi:hypothetical protein